MTQENKITQTTEKSRRSAFVALRVLAFAFILLLSFSARSQMTIVYSQSFTGGTFASPAACSAWGTFRSQLLSTYSYSGFTISGSLDPVGISCHDPSVAMYVANALRTGTTYGGTSDGHSWFVNSCLTNQCGPGSNIELGGDVPSGGCSCSSVGYDVRPGYGVAGWWGGIGSNCAGASQSLTVTFYIQPVVFDGGTAQSFALCENASATAINSLLTITDGLGMTETWTVNAAPLHGVIGGLPTTGPSGLHVSPTGVTYTPAPGYSGTDDFTIKVNNGTQTALTTIHVIINPAPAAVVGSPALCLGTSETLTDVVSGGTWTSSSPLVAAIGSASGTVTAAAVGTSNITYTAPSGCSVVFPMTVNPNPSAIAGPSVVCSGSTISLSNTVAGGSWSSSNTAIATVGATSGVVTGVAAGVVTIDYTLPGGCAASYAVTVNATPAPITGGTSLCAGSSLTLSETTPGGTWTTSNAGVATVGASTGTVSAVSPGSVTITYTLTSGCFKSILMTVNPAPSAVGGPSAVCTGGTITLTNSVSGGTWGTSSSTIAPVGATTGIVTGALAGNATITYTLAGGCYATKSITVNPLPGAISGSSSFCAGTSVTLTDATTGGSWSSSNTAVAAVGTATGITNGVAAGTATISYTSGAGCTSVFPLTVNPAPGAIVGPSAVCPGYTIALTNPVAGGTWTSSNTVIAPVGATTGIVTGGTPGSVVITYMLPGGCSATKSVDVSSALPAISGPATVCVGSSATLADAVPGGAWNSDNTAVVSITTTGVISGLSSGTVTISYALGGCVATKAVTAADLPMGISGASSVCAGAATTLTDATPAGVWSSSNPAVASVGSATGDVTGLAAGTAIITYATGAGCFVSASVIVNPLPAPIAGPAHLCVGNSSTLSDATPGGFWTNGNPSVASLSGTGVAMGLTGGVDTFTYTLSSTGCKAVRAIPVIAVPAFTGLDTMCAWGDTVTINDSLHGGIYVSTSVTVVTIGGGSGIVTSHAPGAASITYIMPEGCSVTETFTVNPLPGIISGAYQVCTGTPAALTSITPGGVWSSGNPSVATVAPATGLLTGITTGTAMITYTLPTGCKVDTLITVSLPPMPIVGASGLCAGTTTLLSDPVSGGTWTSSAPSVASVSGSGALTGLSAGTATITYATGVSCSVTKVVSVNAQPVAYTAVGGGSYCTGGAGEHIWLSGSQSGVSYQLFNGTAPAGAAMMGTGGVVDFGFLTASGTYSVVGTNPATGCTTSMIGMPVVSAVLPPAVYTVTGGGNYCGGTAGVHVGLSGSELGISYQLYYGSVPSGVAVAGAGGAIDFGLRTYSGSYTVVATNTSTTCTSVMNDSVTVTMVPSVVPSVTLNSLAGDTVCAGTLVHLTTTAVNGGSLPAYQWLVNGISTGAATAGFSFTPVNGDVVKVILTSNAACANPDTAGSSLAITVSPVLIPVVVVAASTGTEIIAGESVTFTATATGAGTSPAYQWALNGTAIAGATNATYTTTTIANGDIVSCVVTASDACGTHSGNAQITMTVNNSLSVNHFGTTQDIRIMPNPNKGQFVIAGRLASGTSEPATVEITNMLGQVIFKGAVQVTNGALEMNINLGNDIANGMYILNLYAVNENYAFHIVKEQ